MRRLQHALYHAHESLDAALSRLGAAAAVRFAEQFDLQPLQLVARHAGADFVP